MTLLGNNDPAPYELINMDGTAPLLLTCEHAGRAVPQSLGTLGLDDEDFKQHYTYDPGVYEITHMLSKALNAPALIGNYSRAVVDLGRRREDIAFPTTGEGKPITGNLNLSETDKEDRFQSIYDPYHQKLESLLDDHFLARDIVPMLISVHSFTPVFHGEDRPWEIAFLWAQDARLPHALIKASAAQGYVVGDNEPYNLKIVRGTVVDRYGDSRKLANVMVEYRNDLLRHPADIEKHGNALIKAIQPLLGQAEINSFYDGPQNPYDPEAEKAYFANVLRTVSPDDK